MAKQLFYLTNTRLTAAVWQDGRLTFGPGFDHDEAGWQDFADYLKDLPTAPAHFLIDLIEEDFQRDSIPHVAGKARQSLIERRLNQLYRDTPFRHASMQGREKEGRRDDRLLFNALTNADLPRPWLAALLAAKIPLAGIYSVALLGIPLFKKLRLGTGPHLLVTHQSSGLRQSYFHDGHLRFSRLTQLNNGEPEALAEAATAEIGKTRQFLASTRLLPRDAHISIMMLADTPLLRTIQRQSPDTASVTHHYLPLDQAPSALKWKPWDDSGLADPLFLAMVAGNRIPSHYTLVEQRRFYQLWQTRSVLYIASAATLIGGFAWAAANGMDALDAHLEADMLATDTLKIEARYQNVIRSMPQTVAKPNDMKSAVDLEQLIAQNAPTPEVMLAQISRALEALPQIKLTQLRWRTSETDEAQSEMPAAVQPGGEQALSAAQIGIPSRPFEIVTIEGEVVPFQNDYRSALDSVRQFADALSKNPQLRVEISRMPLDISPKAALGGQAGRDQDGTQAPFALKLVRKP